MQGTIFTKEGIASYLEEANRDYFGRRTWANQFGDVSLAGQIGKEYVAYDFGKAAGEAYRTANANQAAIGASNLIQGNKSAAIAENELALEEAYNSYLQNYRTGVQDVNTSMASQLADLNEQLMSQADYSARYANAHFDYLQSLWNKYESGDISGDFFNRFDYSGYTDIMHDEAGNIVTDVEGNPMRTLKSMNDIKSQLFEEDGQTLTAKGVRFFDQLENDEALRQAGYTFGDYLSETDEDLYNWSIGENLYNYAPNAFGESTNASTFREMVGQVSSEEQYSAIERMFGMSEGDLNNAFGSINNALTNLNAAYTEGKEKDIETALSNFSTQLTKLVSDFGLEEDLIEKMKVQGYEGDSLNDIINEIANIYSEANANEKNKNVFEKIISAYVDTFELVTGISRMPGSSTTPQLFDENRKTDVERAAGDASEQFNNLVATLADYAQDIRRQNEIDFYGKEQTSGGKIEPYNNMISSHNGVYHNFGLSNGKTATFLSSAVLKGTVRDKNNDNYSISYDGETYNLEMGKETLTGNDASQISDYIYQSTGRLPQQGDTFYYDGKLWTVTEDNTIRSVKNRFLSNDYNNLISKLTRTFKRNGTNSSIEKSHISQFFQ